MAAKACTKCGSPLPVQIGRGRRRIMCESCSPSRNRGQGKPRLTVVGSGSSLLAAVRSELAAADVSESAAGQAAILLAERIESGSDSGSAVAQMVRQLHDTMARALAGQPQTEVDPVAAFRAELDRI